MNDVWQEVGRWALWGDRIAIDDSEAWDVGLPCGGEIDVWVQAYEPGPFERAARAGGRAAELTLLRGTSGWRQAFVTPDAGHVGSLGSAQADADAVLAARADLWTDTSAWHGAVFIDVVAPPARLLLVGAVDIAGAVCALARATGWRASVIDPRARFATPERFSDAEDVLALWPEEAFARLGGIDPATASRSPTIPSLTTPHSLRCARPRCQPTRPRTSARRPEPRCPQRERLTQIPSRATRPSAHLPG
jgi:xanthine/CO dehydrogenase XdhC/CoxF family maturation factor